MLNRSIKPEPTGKIDFSLPIISNFNLKNNLNVFHVLKNNLPLVHVSLIIKAGNVFVPDNKNGLAALTSMLIDEGAGKLTALEISDKFEFLGSIFNINANKEYITISLLTLRENLDESLDLFSLIITSPTFNNSDFSREVERLKSQVIYSESDPSYLASKEFYNLLYKNTPYQFPTNGTVDSINQISNDDVINFYKNYFSPVNSSLVIVGNIDSNEAKTLLNNSLGNWYSETSSSQFPSKIEKSSKTVLLVNKESAPQSEIRVGHFSTKRNADDFFAKTVLNNILGGQFSSRLNLSLREQKGFTYGVHSSFTFNQLGSTFSITTSVEAKNTIGTLDEILIEVENIRKGVSEKEVSFVKSYLNRRFPSLFETFSNVSNNISLIPIYKLELDYFNNYLNKIKSVEMNELKTAAKSIFLPDQLIIVVVGNKKNLEQDLKDFAFKNKFKFIVK